MRTKYLIIVLCCVYSLHSVGQTNNHKMKSHNAVYIDAPTLNTIVTLNYDRVLYDAKWLKWSGRIGIASNFQYKIDVCIPIETSLLIGKGNHYAEIGTGIASYFLQSDQNIAEWGNNTTDEYWFVSRLGYRLQNKHFILRAAYTPYWLIRSGWHPSSLGNFVHGPSLSLGYAF